CHPHFHPLRPPLPPRPPPFPYPTLFRPLLQIVVSSLAHNDGTQAQAVAATGLFDQDAGQQATDTAKAVEHHVGALVAGDRSALRSEEHTSELQSRENLVCRLLLEKKKPG